jgi:signal transduction histidine kinase
MASQEIERITKLLHEYRSFARPHRLRLESVDLRRILEEVLAPNIGPYTAGGIRVQTQFEDSLPLVHVDQERIKQVILNLCKNAVEAMPAGGVLTCKAHQSGDRLVLEVSDTGVGIPDGLDVFQLFSTTKTEETGLGLAIVQQIVSEHGGAIDYISTPGRGTTFRLSLPLATQ